MALALILVMALSLPPDLEVLVLLDGTRIVVQGEVQVKGTKALFRERGGAFYSLDLEEIDVAATRAAAVTAAATATTTPPAKTLVVSDEEKRRLLKELSLSRGRPAPRPAATEAPSPAPSPSPAGESAKQEDEDAWRARGRAAQAAVDRAKADLEDLQRHEDNLEAQLLMLRGYGDHLLTAQLLELERTRYALGVAQRSLEEAKRSLFELQEEARKKDILPGWLR